MIILDFTRFLYLSLGIGNLRSDWGDGRTYLTQRSLRVRNHDPDDGFDVVSWYSAILWMTEPGILDIIPNIENILRCKMALPGSCPPRNITTQWGVRSGNFWSLCRASLIH